MHTPEGSGETDRESHCQPFSSGNSSEDEAEMLDPGLLFPVSNPSSLTQSLLRLRSCRGHLPPSQRRKREMTPAEKKDTIYWDKRRKNNEAAKRSREKRRFSDMLLEGQMLALSEENAWLRAQVLSLHRSIDLRQETSTISAASGLPSQHSPALVHYPTANVQPRLWGYSLANPLSLLGEPQPPAPRGDAGAGLGPLSLHGGCDSGSHHSQRGHPRFLSPLLLSQRRAWGLEIGASAEAENAAHHQVVSTGTHPNIQESPSASTKAFLPFSHPLCPTSTLSPSSQPWLIPSLSHPDMRNNLLMSSCLASTILFPNMPLYFPMGLDEDQGQCRDNPEGLQARFNTLSVELAQPRKYWSPDRSD